MGDFIAAFQVVMIVLEKPTLEYRFLCPINRYSVASGSGRCI
jgi:hypothetical protein